MDPEATFAEMGNAIENEEWGLAGELADALTEWFARGGFCPRITGKPTFDKVIAKATAEAIASWNLAE